MQWDVRGYSAFEKLLSKAKRF